MKGFTFHQYSCLLPPLCPDASQLAPSTASLSRRASRIPADGQATSQIREFWTLSASVWATLAVFWQENRLVYVKIRLFVFPAWLRYGNAVSLRYILKVEKSGKDRRRLQRWEVMQPRRGSKPFLDLQSPNFLHKQNKIQIHMISDNGHTHPFCSGSCRSMFRAFAEIIRKV